MTTYPGDGYDIFSADFTTHPHRTFDAIRGSGCPVGHSDERGGSWMPVTFDDIRSVTRSPEEYSSRTSQITGPTVMETGSGLLIPPITSDPPEHKPHRDILMPWFTPAAVKAREPFVRQTTRDLIAAILERGEGDLITDFAQRLTVATLADMLDVPDEMQGQLVDWTTRMFRVGALDEEVRTRTGREILDFFGDLLAERRAHPGDDLLSHIAAAEGEYVGHKHRLGTAFVILLAGADTTWASLGASLWHLGHHHEDRDRLVADPSLLDTAIEELMRFYAPVSVVRTATRATELCGRRLSAGDRVIASFAAANRDPEAFPDPDDVQLDRRHNKHLAFGTGAHRCIGASLARLEMKIALEEWLRAMPRFEVLDPESVTWTGGAVRGPENARFVCEPVS